MWDAFFPANSMYMANVPPRRTRWSHVRALPCDHRHAGYECVPRGRVLGCCSPLARSGGAACDRSCVPRSPAERSPGPPVAVRQFGACDWSHAGSHRSYRGTLTRGRLLAPCEPVDATCARSHVKHSHVRTLAAPANVHTPCASGRTKRSTQWARWGGLGRDFLRFFSATVVAAPRRPPRWPPPSRPGVMRPVPCRPGVMRSVPCRPVACAGEPLSAEHSCAARLVGRRFGCRASGCPTLGCRTCVCAHGAVATGCLATAGLGTGGRGTSGSPSARTCERSSYDRLSCDPCQEGGRMCGRPVVPCAVGRPSVRPVAL